MKVYIYPTYTPRRDKSGNLYIKYFHQSFQKEDGIETVNRLWKIGISSIAFNLDAEVFIIQWVDLIPSKRLGKIQFLLFLFLILLISLMNKKIVWILHNKRAHNNKSQWVDFGMSFMAKYATCVVTHSEEGVTFFNKHYPEYRGKCYYIPHPVYTTNIYTSETVKYDYVIWGSVSRRKRILEFLRFVNNSGFMKSKKILICGKCNDEAYAREIYPYVEENPNICYINKFLDDDLLRQTITKGKVILFTYNADTVLSSGALIYSLNFCKPIIGPNVGSFADLQEIVSVYNTFSDIPLIKVKANETACIDYIKENQWQYFPKKIMNILEIIQSKE